jgi:hypothetical protein
MRAVVQPLEVMLQPRGEQHRLPQMPCDVSSQQQYWAGPSVGGGA